MQFQHSWQKILSGEKTQTRRLVHPRQRLVDRSQLGMPPAVVTFSGLDDPAPRVLYYVGQTLAVQPARTAKAIARIRILNIWHDADIRRISDTDALAEGFEYLPDFLFTWISMCDKSWLETYRYASDCGTLRDYGFYERPANRYNAWVLEFELAQP
jgi:hypothetical protein